MDEQKLLETAYTLSIITIVYNLLEGSFSTFFGYSDDTLALFGFGVDSFIEVISAVGIAHMIWRMKRSVVEKRDEFERQALRITGLSFYLLVVGIIVGVGISLWYDTVPETTLVGILVSVTSIGSMFFLYRYKYRTGKLLNSDAIIADANCTKTCFYLSFILLFSSGMYYFFKVPYVDLIGSTGIAWFAFKEGKEVFELSNSDSLKGCSC